MSKFESIDTWDEVDNALKRIGEIDIAKNKIEGDTTLKINEIKTQAKTLASGLDAERAGLEKLITLFAESKKEEFIKKRTRVLNFGKVGYRVVKTVSMPRDKTKLASLIKSLKAFSLSDCIEYVEKPIKEKIAELPDEMIVKLGMSRKVKDSFRIEPDIEKIESE